MDLRIASNIDKAHPASINAHAPISRPRYPDKWVPDKVLEERYLVPKPLSQFVRHILRSGMPLYPVICTHRWVDSPAAEQTADDLV